MAPAPPVPRDDGNVVGNVYDKYGTRNPIAQLLMRGFLDAVTSLVRSTTPRRVLEVGCGEGRLADHLARAVPSIERISACDLSLAELASGLEPRIEFHEASIYALPHEAGSFDTVVCCEVLEHLSDPAAGLAELARVARTAVVVSTPREPMWRALNMARGKYLRALGNTPGHVQHFSRRALVGLVARRLEVEAVRAPLPWTVVLARPRSGAHAA